MRPALQRRWTSYSTLILVFVFSSGVVSAKAEPLSLKRAVELALTHSTAAAEANSDEQRAFASYREARNQYVPQLVVGSGLGDSWGYPLTLEGTAPSLFNVTAQSSLYNPALREFVRAARFEHEAVIAENKDRRNQIIQDAVLTYLELVKWEELMAHLHKQHDDAVKWEQVVSERMKEGVDSAQMGTQARLSTARVRLHITQAEGAVEVLRTALSHLTGVPVASLQTDPDSIPTLPETALAVDSAAKAAESSPSVLFAEQHALAQGFRARGEHRSLWPSMDFATQYAVLAKFNNWLQFFPTKSFERNNATVGVVIRFPFLNYSQKAHAEAADADAIRARKEVEGTKNQVSQETLKLQHSVEQLKAAQEVSELEYEIARSDVDAVNVRVNSGTAGVHDADNARTQMAEKYTALEDARFELVRARIALLRTTGELEPWAKQGK